MVPFLETEAFRSSVYIFPSYEWCYPMFRSRRLDQTAPFEVTSNVLARSFVWQGQTDPTADFHITAVSLKPAYHARNV